MAISRYKPSDGGIYWWFGARIAPLDGGLEARFIAPCDGGMRRGCSTVRRSKRVTAFATLRALFDGLGGGTGTTTLDRPHWLRGIVVGATPKVAKRLMICTSGVLQVQPCAGVPSAYIGTRAFAHFVQKAAPTGRGRRGEPRLHCSSRAASSTASQRSVSRLPRCVQCLAAVNARCVMRAAIRGAGEQ